MRKPRDLSDDFSKNRPFHFYIIQKVAVSARHMVENQQQNLPQPGAMGGYYEFSPDNRHSTADIDQSN